MAEKNIAAFLREDAHTVGVRFYKETIPSGTASSFDPNNVTLFSGKEYTYVTTKKLTVGDHAVVLVHGVPKVVYVSRVDDDLCIEPNEEKKYSWIVDYVNIASYEADMEKNEALELTINTAYKASLRNQFRTMILGQVSDDVKSQLLTILEK